MKGVLSEDGTLFCFGNAKAYPEVHRYLIVVKIRKGQICLNIQNKDEWEGLDGTSLIS